MNLKLLFSKSLLLILILFKCTNAVEDDYNLSSVIELTDKSFYSAVKDDSEWMIAFTANWCSACKNLKPEFEKVGHFVNTKLPKVKMAYIDVDKNPALVNQFFILRLPTIYHIKGKEVRSVEINRDFETMKTFLYQAEWKKVDPFKGLFAPFSTIPNLIFTVIFYFNQILNYVKTLPGWAVSFLPVVLIGFALYHIGKSTPTTPPPNTSGSSKKNK